MTNTNDGQETTRIESKKERKKYVRSGKFSKKNKIRAHEVELVESETDINTGGLNIEFSPKVFQEIEKEEVRRIESVFRNEVLNSFEDYISKLNIEVEELSTDGTQVELSSEVAQKSVNYSRELGPKDILTPQSEYRLRCHIGVKLTMDWSTNQILNLKREVSRYKKLVQKLDIPSVTLNETVEPKPSSETTESTSPEQTVVVE